MFFKSKRLMNTLFATLMVGAGILAGCGGGTAQPQTGTAGGGASPAAVADSSGEESKQWKVTVTTGMVGDLVTNIGGNHVAVTQLMGPGVDPHLFKASQGDIARIDEAEIIFYSGLHLEGKMGEIFEKMSKQKPVIPVTSAIPESDLMADPAAPDQYDPHVWFDVSMWIKTIDVVRDELSKLDPANKAEYHANADAYRKKLEELDQYAKEQIATIPKDQRVLVTAHDAFSYFGRAYEIEVMGLQGISTASEYGLKDVQGLVDTLVSRGIKAVFIESSVPKNSIEAVVEGARAKDHTVEIGGELFSDAMGEPGTEEGTYIGMVKHNVDTIVTSLQ
ncbi:zinc ABC transporter substrate-binding protein [Brevibacillus humidisoli]|uniref:metal ABC transporter solute-binding protein, Zn/Mn family n=1 Tax=Brevibacillus humidisoli TaxID=2895522 RepID=UPI001E3AE198|nr:zinc ABC transporter substrate-binding protein [Brevibacillus humidisoli]UFJ43085.1 zinc ABC transporter substrate-binding protein [Brevibacillus humidisoli]